MYKIKTLLIVLGFCTANHALAVSTAKEICAEPRFSKFSPPRLSELAPGSKFSFSVYVLGGRPDPETIEVFVKKIKAEISVEDRTSFLRVVGTIPKSLSGTFARIALKAYMERENGQPFRSCRAKDGWLVKITGEDAAPPSKNQISVIPDNDQVTDQ